MVKMKDFDSVDELVEMLDKVPELVQAGIALSQKTRETIPMQEIADEVKALVLSFAPVGKIVKSAMQALLRDDILVRAQLIKEVQATGLTEATALALVLSRNDAFTKAIEKGFKTDKTAK